MTKLWCVRWRLLVPANVGQSQGELLILTCDIIMIEEQGAIPHTARYQRAIFYVSQVKLWPRAWMTRTYKPPNRKSPPSPTLCTPGRCRRHTIGRGIKRMMRSVTIHGIGVIMPTSCLFPQCPAIDGFQLRSTGMQIKTSAKKVPIHHSRTTTPKIHVEIRKACVMKTRRYKIRTESFVTAKALGCSAPTVCHS